MNDREFKKHLQAIARGEEPAERDGQVLGQERSAKKPSAPKKPASKSKQSTPRLGQLRVRRKAS